MVMQMHKSIWLKNTQLPECPPLEGDLRTDVLIVGGGLAGLLCAHRLTQAGVDCALIEADRICHGTSGNTTAKITSQHGLRYGKLLRRFGAGAARQYYDAMELALREYRTLCAGKDCDFETKDSYIYATDSDLQLREEMDALKQLGIPAEWAEAKLPFSTAGAIRFRDQAQFNPVKLTAVLAPDLRIYEHTAAQQFAPGQVMTDRGTIQAKQIIVATHFPILNKHGGYFLKMYQQRSYVLALEGAELVDGMYLDAKENGLSFRNQGNLLLLGGGGHRTGKDGGGWRELEDFAWAHYPKAKERCRWAAQDCMTLDAMPYIGRYSKGTPNLYAATGFNKWGMTSSMLSAMILSDLVQGKKHPDAGLFDPGRSIFHPQLAANLWHSTVNLLTPTTPRCPHLGCALKWNPKERSWDCPCHGSRFDGDGKLLDGPANRDLE